MDKRYNLQFFTPTIVFYMNRFQTPRRLFNQNKSIIFYNHRERKPEEEYLNKFRKLKEIDTFKNSAIMGLKFRRGTIRFYIFVLQPQHVCIVKDCCDSLLDSEWKEHFSLLNI